MSRTLEEYVSLPYHVRVFQDRWDDQICYIAYHDELPGCKAQGETWQEAVASLNEARRDYIAALLEDGMEVPCPQPVNAPPSAWQLLSGSPETAFAEVDNLPGELLQEAVASH